ncbi:Hypothetical predicted protein [Podarcis lilfordi]|uniref:Uncharacterized protein n=1 Tax=Podarcis lilfordi TaxID=74358 RepID=A0AA35L6R3_9SAUR|nr:Hypothetical predicted protein [Podarcis lilfordi]
MCDGDTRLWRERRGGGGREATPGSSSVHNAVGGGGEGRGAFRLAAPRRLPPLSGGKEGGSGEQRARDGAQEAGSAEAGRAVAGAGAVTGLAGLCGAERRPGVDARKGRKETRGLCAHSSSEPGKPSRAGPRRPSAFQELQLRARNQWRALN